MSGDKYHHTSKTPDESLHDLNLLGLWSQCGIDWSSTFKEESKAATNEPVVEEPNSTNKVVLLGVLTVLALLIAATWIQAQKIYQVMQETGKNSIEQLIFRDH